MPKKTEKATPHNVSLYTTDLAIIERKMDELGISFSAAVRVLVRAGERGPATSPFTPIEGHNSYDH